VSQHPLQAHIFDVLDAASFPRREKDLILSIFVTQRTRPSLPHKNAVSQPGFHRASRHISSFAIRSRIFHPYDENRPKATAIHGTGAIEYISKTINMRDSNITAGFLDPATGCGNGLAPFCLLFAWVQ
jgi:hypothetical protein